MEFVESKPCDYNGQNVPGRGNKTGAMPVCWGNSNDPQSRWGEVEEERVGRKVREWVRWEW